MISEMAVDELAVQSSSDGKKPETAPIRLVFEAPDQNAPGFLQRQRLFAGYIEAWTTGKISVEIVDQISEEIVQFVKEPSDREEALRLIRNCSAKQIGDMVVALTGQTGEKQSIPLANTPR